MAMQHLLSHGHSKIAFWGSDELPNYYIRCFTGYQRSMSEAKLIMQPEWLQTSANGPSNTSAAVDRLLDCAVPPTAVCCMSDLAAIYGISRVQERGLSVPKDLSFISIDDILLSRYITPPLTSVSYDKSAMGRTAAKLLLSKIAGEPVQSKTISKLTLAERRSVRSIVEL